MAFRILLNFQKVSPLFYFLSLVRMCSVLLEFCSVYQSLLSFIGSMLSIHLTEERSLSEILTISDKLDFWKSYTSRGISTHVGYVY